MSAIIKNIQNFGMKNAETIKIIMLLVLIGALIYLVQYGYKNKENFYMEFAKYSPLTEKSDMKDNLSGEGQEKLEVTGPTMYADNFYGDAPVIGEQSQETLSPEDLLPKTDLNDAFEQDKGVMMGNFVIPDLAYPVDTIGSSGKKANYALRAMPLIPVNMNVSPWQVSTYEPDLFRKPLE